MQFFTVWTMVRLTRIISMSFKADWMKFMPTKSFYWLTIKFYIPKTEHAFLLCVKLHYFPKLNSVSRVIFLLVSKRFCFNIANFYIIVTQLFLVMHFEVARNFSEAWSKFFSFMNLIFQFAFFQH